MASQRDPRHLFILLAIALSLISGVVLTVLIVRASSTTPQTTQADQDDSAASIFAPIPGQNGQGGLAGGGSGLFIQVMDRRDPTRLSMELRSTQMDPIGPDLYSVAAPRAWVFMKDGASIHITAADGTLVLPDRAREPESGTLQGGVTIRRFPNIGRRIDPELDEPEMTFVSQTLSFDLTLGEISTPDRIIVTTLQGELIGTDLRMNVNEPLERIDLFRLSRGESLRLRPRSGSSTQQATKTNESTSEQSSSPRQATEASAAVSSSVPSGAAQPVRPSTATRPDPLESFYRAVFQDEVVLVQSGRTVRGDQLEVWTRLIDNKLAVDAIPSNSASVGRNTPPAPGSSTQDGAQPTSPTDTPTSAITDPNSDDNAEAGNDLDSPDENTTSTEPASSEVRVADADQSSDEDVLLTWTGMAEIRPLTSRPDMLNKDEIAGRFTAERTGRVLLGDENADANAATGALDYYATTRRVVMASPGMTGVELTSVGKGTARIGRLELDLVTGIGFAPGAGLVEDGSGRGRVTWNEQADLIFETDERGMTGVLREALCSGAVRAQKDLATLEGDFVRTVFAADSKGALKLQRLAARGQVRTNDGAQGNGTCAALDVLFDVNDPSDNPQPTDILARGNAQFNDGPDRIEAELIDASLMPDERGGVTVRRLHTFGATKITQLRDGVELAGGEVLLHEDRQSARITGPGALVKRAGVRITAAGNSDVIELDGLGRRAMVTGQGTFWRQTRSDDGTIGTLDASWTESMAFDDYAGTLDCVGNVNAVYQPEPMRREAVEGRIVNARFEPYKANDNDQDNGVGGEQPNGDGEDSRELLTFRAVGSEQPGGSIAAVESIELEPVDGAEPRLAKVMRLTGNLIDVNQTQGTVDVPTAGGLIVSDQRQAVAADKQATAIFQWDRSFVYNRNSGQATMTGGVELRHRRRAGEPITDLAADTMRALLVSSQEVGLQNNAGTDASLRSARAEGNVVLVSGYRQALANSMDYDAINSTAALTGAQGGMVTIIDTQRTGNATRAGRIFWDLARDRIDIVDAGPFRGTP